MHFKSAITDDTSSAITFDAYNVMTMTAKIALHFNSAITKDTGNDIIKTQQSLYM